MEKLIEEFFETLPFLMASNIDENLDYIPEDHVVIYIIHEVLPEIEYEKSPDNPYLTYSKQELDDLEKISRKILECHNSNLRKEMKIAYNKEIELSLSMYQPKQKK